MSAQKNGSLLRMRRAGLFGGLSEEAVVEMVLEKGVVGVCIYAMSCAVLDWESGLVEEIHSASCYVHRHDGDKHSQHLPSESTCPYADDKSKALNNCKVCQVMPCNSE